MEGSLEAPTRHVIPWRDEAWYDDAALEAELRRVFDICHGCRRCFNLCDSFPTLFDAIDESPNEAVADLDAGQLKAVVDACTLCDMCFMTKCPYVPPHVWDVDFPHLILRYRAVEHRKGAHLAGRPRARQDGPQRQARRGDGAARQLGDPSLATSSPAGHGRRAGDRPARAPAAVRDDAAGQPGAGADPARPIPTRRVSAARWRSTPGCHDNYNDATPGHAAMKVFAHNGVRVRVEYPECCGMPKLENGDMEAVATAARRGRRVLRAADRRGLGGGAADHQLRADAQVRMAADRARRSCRRSAQPRRPVDVPEYVVRLAKEVGLAPIGELPKTIGVHFACHARAQNMGPKALEMLRLIPEAKPLLTERCSGHGGKWGVFKEPTSIRAIKIGKPTGRALAKNKPDLMVSECPLAGPHLRQVIEANGETPPPRIGHPIEVMALAYGL